MIHLFRGHLWWETYKTFKNQRGVISHDRDISSFRYSRTKQMVVKLVPIWHYWWLCIISCAYYHVFICSLVPWLLVCCHPAFYCIYNWALHTGQDFEWSRCHVIWYFSTIFQLIWDVRFELKTKDCQSFFPSDLSPERSSSTTFPAFSSATHPGTHCTHSGSQGGGAALLWPGESEAPAGDSRAESIQETDGRGAQQYDPSRQDEGWWPASGAPATPGADLQDQVGLREGHPQTGMVYNKLHQPRLGMR